jgi:hypothetical protein
VALESLIFIAGLIYYLKSTKTKNKIGIFGFWGLILFLVLIYLSNLVGSPPPNVQAIAWAGEMQWIFVIWAYWVDRNRLPKEME